MSPRYAAGPALLPPDGHEFVNKTGTFVDGMGTPKAGCKRNASSARRQLSAGMVREQDVSPRRAKAGANYREGRPASLSPSAGLDCGFSWPAAPGIDQCLQG